MDGSDKLKILVVGNSKHPRYIKCSTFLPVDYQTRTKDLTNLALCEVWLPDLECDMKIEKRKNIASS